MRKPTGYVIWEGASPIDGAPIAMIITFKSSNDKTGDMLQTWILRTDMHPIEAIKQEADRSICGDCVHRPANLGSCYVEVGKAPAAVYRCHTRGGYPPVDWADLARRLRGRKIRFGAYGDPGMVPLQYLVRLASLADGWTGYTHQWRTLPTSYSHYLMSSADTDEQRAEARAAGWRSFFVTPADEEEIPEGAILCLAEREVRARKCIDCTACSGTREGAVTNAPDVFIRAHGKGKTKFVGV